ncbi:hypothetical protein IEQ34_002690 [Dendrobium chrysotoxum]|uniref:Uncharacterized protein n=1 Tax=Dendrobium chrysotoxum TaxID=161865 RepID=A0AAV7HI98_DENCH|nr:hypothetical protein IEQ34_002690 [Dendrobium chrysotoxum]
MDSEESITAYKLPNKNKSRSYLQFTWILPFPPTEIHARVSWSMKNMKREHEVMTFHVQNHQCLYSKEMIIRDQVQGAIPILLERGSI